jgi:nucleotide-binding universal stress UspA family protein
MSGVAVRPQVRVGPPARRIVEVAGEEQVDLIVMASRGYGPLGQVLLGSTAERVLHHAPCPVLVVRDGRE